MGYNKSLGIHGIFKKERFTEKAYKELSYLKPEVKNALIVDVENNTFDTKGGRDKRARGGGKTIELEYKGPAFSPSTKSPGSVSKLRTADVKLMYDAKFYDPRTEAPSSKPSNPRIYFKEEEGHDTYKNGEYIFVEQSNIYEIKDVIENIANKYADTMANAWGMTITLDDDDNITIKEMNNEEKMEYDQRIQDEKDEAKQRIQEEKNEAERIEAELEELWASRAELIENVQKNTTIVNIVGPHTEQAHRTDPIRKYYPEGYVDLKYKGNTYRYTITFDFSSSSSFESEVVEKAGTHIYFINNKNAEFKELEINDLIFTQQANNIRRFRELLYTLSKKTPEDKARAGLIKNVKDNTTIVTMPNAIDKEPSIDLNYNQNIFKYTIVFRTCPVEGCETLEDESKAKAGTHIYFKDKYQFEELEINDLIFTQQANNIYAFDEVLYRLAQRPIPILGNYTNVSNGTMATIIAVVMTIFFLGLAWWTYLSTKATAKAAAAAAAAKATAAATAKAATAKAAALAREIPIIANAKLLPPPASLMV